MMLRLIADDLTGALDTAAEFAGLAGAIPVRWDLPESGSAALDAGTREASRAEAEARVRALAPALLGADIAFKKFDSLLRGQVGAELAACIAAAPWRSVVVAPAFPAQGRITRDLRQMARQQDGSWQQAGRSLSDLLTEAGIAWRKGDPDAALPPGVSVFDAVEEQDLDRIAMIGKASPGPVLWCGSGGLGRALARGHPAPVNRLLRRPVLGLFGSDQPVTARQLAACEPFWHRISDSDPSLIDTSLSRDGAALVSVVLPGNATRESAAARIAEIFGALAHAVPPPGTLIAAGGETLRALCDALGARALAAQGLVAPGVPRSALVGGRWDGVAVISKSGAFGHDALWRDLLAENGLLRDKQA